MRRHAACWLRLRRAAPRAAMSTRVRARYRAPDWIAEWRTAADRRRARRARRRRAARATDAAATPRWRAAEGRRTAATPQRAWRRSGRIARTIAAAGEARVRNKPR